MLDATELLDQRLDMTRAECVAEPVKHASGPFSGGKTQNSTRHATQPVDQMVETIRTHNNYDVVPANSTLRCPH